MKPDDNTTSINQQQEKLTKNIFRTRKTAHFVTISTLPLFDRKLTLKAKGLWAFGMGHPNNWTFHLSELEKHCSEGIKAIYGAFNELIENGYAARFSYQEKDPVTNRWYWGGNEYIFLEDKHTPEQVAEILEEFKKCFPHRRFRRAEVGRAHNGTLIRDNSLVEHDSLEDNAPSEDVAPVLPPPSLATKKIEFANPANHPGYEAFNAKYGPLVGLLLDQHNALVAKHGREVVLRAYEYLASWKISKAETDAKAITKHTDYYRLTKWVIKEIIESGTSTPGTYKRTGKLAISADVRAMEEMKANPRKIQTEEEMEAWAEQRLKDLESKSQKVKS